MNINIKVGDIISIVYHDKRKFYGEVTLVENQKSDDGVVWSDGARGVDRTMIRIRNEKGNFQSVWLDKCVSFEIK